MIDVRYGIIGDPITFRDQYGTYHRTYITDITSSGYVVYGTRHIKFEDVIKLNNQKVRPYKKPKDIYDLSS